MEIIILFHWKEFIYYECILMMDQVLEFDGIRVLDAK